MLLVLSTAICISLFSDKRTGLLTEKGVKVADVSAEALTDSHIKPQYVMGGFKRLFRPIRNVMLFRGRFATIPIFEACAGPCVCVCVFVYICVYETTNEKEGDNLMNCLIYGIYQQTGDLWC